MAPALMRTTGETLFVDSADIVTGPDFERIWITTDKTGRPSVMFKVNEAAAKKLGFATAENLDKMMAIVVNGVPETAVPISAPFSDSFQINGRFSKDQIQQFHRAVTGYANP